jgi:hypothetical protein
MGKLGGGKAVNIYRPPAGILDKVPQFSQGAPLPDGIIDQDVFLARRDLFGKCRAIEKLGQRTFFGASGLMTLDDIRQAGIRAAQNAGGYYGGYCGAPVVIYGTNPASAWMDIAFRAGSPELYRYTMPQPAKINIYENVTVNANPAPAGFTLDSPESVGLIDYGYRPPMLSPTLRCGIRPRLCSKLFKCYA